MEIKQTSWKVIATMSTTLLAEYIFAIEEEAQIFKKSMLKEGYEVVMFKVNI